MKKIIILLTLLLSYWSLSATTYYRSANGGNWTDPLAWTPSYPGTTISNGDTVIIQYMSTFSWLDIDATSIQLNGVLITEQSYYNINIINGSEIIIGTTGKLFNSAYLYMFDSSKIEVSGSMDIAGTGQDEFRVGDSSKLIINPSGTVFFEDSIGVSGDIIVNGTLINDANLENWGTISGTGSIITSTLTSNGNIFGPGTVAPGLSPGELKTEFDYQLPAAGTLEIELGGLIPGTEYDVLGGTGDKTLAGHLDIKNYNGFMASAGDAFEIIKGDNIVGTFDSVTYPPLSGSAVWKLFYGTDNVTLAAVYALDVTNHTTQDISIYPNPTNGQLFINGSKEMKYFVIRNSLGQIVQSGIIENNSLQISTINTGLYFVELQDEGKNKIVKSVYLK